MKTTILILKSLLLLSITCWYGCSDSEDTTTPAGVLELGIKGDLHFAGTETEKIVTLTTNQSNVTIMSDMDWCRGERVENNIKVVVDPNNEGVERQARLTITSVDDKSLKTVLNVIQSAEEMTTASVFGTDSIYFPYKGLKEILTLKLETTIVSATIPGAFEKYFKISNDTKTVTIQAVENTTLFAQNTTMQVKLGNDFIAKIKLCLGTKTYQIGDILDVNGEKGVIYEMNKDGSGKAISVKEWSGKSDLGLPHGSNGWNGCYPCWMEDNANYDRYFGMTKNDGQANMNIWREYNNTIKNDETWTNTAHEYYYPHYKDLAPFFWCDQLNKEGAQDWYLPSVDELVAFFQVFDGQRDLFNEMCTNNGGIAFSSSLKYQTSSEGFKTEIENPERCDDAYYVEFVAGSANLTLKKEKPGMAVRAIIQFGK